jgi:hypothetical protein
VQIRDADRLALQLGSGGDVRPQALDEACEGAIVGALGGTGSKVGLESGEVCPESGTLIYAAAGSEREASYAGCFLSASCGNQEGPV